MGTSNTYNSAVVMYEIWVRIGDRGGLFTPDNGKVVGSLREAITYANELLSRVDELMIMEKRVVRRIKGQRAQEQKSEGGHGNASPPPREEPGQ